MTDLKQTLKEADELLRIARTALQKMRLEGLGSDCRLSHEVRMFALEFSRESRDGPGVLQVNGTGRALKCLEALRAALAQAEPVQPAQVHPEVAAGLTTGDLAWLETRRLTKLSRELGQMRWAGADEGWDLAINAVRGRIDDECQAVLDWKAKVDQSNATAIELLQKMQGLKDD